MGRLSRFEDARFLGDRETMKVYDCDDEEQFQVLRRRVESRKLLDRNQLQSFAPDTPEEATNRGFRPVG